YRSSSRAVGPAGRLVSCCAARGIVGSAVSCRRRASAQIDAAAARRAQRAIVARALGELSLTSRSLEQRPWMPFFPRPALAAPEGGCYARLPPRETIMAYRCNICGKGYQA